MTTLDSYLEDNSVDLVDSILTDPDGNAYSYSNKAGKAIWATYRYAMMNCKPTEKYITRWIQRGRDIAYNLDERYSQLFTAYEALKTAGKPTSIDMTDSGTVTTHREGSGTDTTDLTQTTDDDAIVTDTEDADGSTVQTGSTTTSETTTTEDIPQTANASASQWLTNRGKHDATVTPNTTDTVKNDVTRKHSVDGNVIVTNKGTNGRTDTEDMTVTDSRSSTYGSLPVELMQRMRNGLFNPYLEYATEFADLWVPFFVDEGCWCE